jgi:thiamine biosynthesis lipoprotein ApbE
LRINLIHRITEALVAALMLAACRREPATPPASRVWPAMERMLSAAAWRPASRDSTHLARALDAVHDSVERVEELMRGTKRIGALDSLRREIRERTGVAVAADSLAAGYALDRAALALAGVADSALLDLGGQFLWIGPPTRRSVGIPDPDNSLRALATVTITGGSVRTTSQREPGRVRSVTVLAPTAIAADAWSLAFFVMGCDSALALAPRLARWRVSVVCADSTGVRWTPDLEHRVLLPRGAVERPARVP